MTGTPTATRAKKTSRPAKWYFEDVGLRNVRLNFRQQEETHIMENVIYNDLVAHECATGTMAFEVNYDGKCVEAVLASLATERLARRAYSISTRR